MNLKLTPNRWILNNVINRSNFILKPIVPEYSHFNIIDLLREMKSLYIHEAVHREKSIDIESDYIDSIKADYELFIQVLYNLIDNAVKYSYRGTIIKIKTEENSVKKVRISITSYGPQISPSSNIYKLYFRGENVIPLEDGLGIGMYVANKIVTAHNGSLNHTSEKISNFSISCLYHFTQSNTIQNILEVTTIENLKEAIKGVDFSEFIAFSRKGNPRFIPYADTFLSEINRITYKNIFFINIPKS